MKSALQHLQFNIDPANVGFYRDLMGFLGWTTLYDDHGSLGVGDGGDLSLWFTDTVRDVPSHYDGPGALNHLGIHVESQADVDAVVTWLEERGIPALFDTPRHHPEYSQGDHTYYQVMFESPDRVLLEVVYTGPKQG